VLFLPLPTSLPSAPGTTDLFIVVIVLPFPEYSTGGIFQYAVFSDWLLLPSNVHLSFLHKCLCLQNFFYSFLELNNMPLS
jgi:hypothetical protein